MALYFLYAVVSATMQLVSSDVYMKVPFPEVEQEQFASFECLQSGTHKNVRVLKWLFNGAPLPRDTRITSARSPYYNYLQIGTSLPKHSGVYTCVAQDGGEIRNASGKLFVACPIKPYKQPITKALLGSNISLQCDGECYRYIMWAKNNDYVTSTESERFSSPGNGSILHITNVSLSDNGTFTCDFYLLKMKRAFVQLLVIVPADHVTVRNSNEVAEIGHRYEIQCQSNGIPRPESVSWFNNSVHISQTNRVSMQYDGETGTATLALHRVTRFDLSSITCRFKQTLNAQKLNYVAATNLITPTGKPDAPTNVTLDLYVSRPIRFHLSWAAPRFTGHLRMLAYRVSYWNDNDCRGASVTACSIGEYWLDDSVLSHEFEPQGYSSRARVCVSVQSVNNNGLSVASEATCVGVRRSVSSPPPYTLQPPAHDISNTYTHVPKTRAEFQALLRNVDLCSGTIKVGQELVTKALASHFSWLCSCNISPQDLNVISYVQLSGIVYYHGTILSSTPRHLIENLSQSIQTGKAMMPLYDNYLLFLHTCPTIPSQGECTISTADNPVLRCQSTEDKLREDATAAAATEDSTPWLSLPSIIIISVLGCLLLFAIVISIVAFAAPCRHYNQAVGDKDGFKKRSQSEFANSNKKDHAVNDQLSDQDADQCRESF
ncbi:hemicentin-1-like isoform X2 [Corticium candelabrum]|uniref:hemicentin-1-like isoform X2 n=1 Tax=Corticium candelabrum TaxID=121492 RepID=UPI002E25E6B2|nr:hemicentin-1-like isoform X2 [Corticium candelabrum]